MIPSKSPIDPWDPLDIGVALLNHVTPKRNEIVLHSLPDLDDSIIAIVDELVRAGRQPTLLLDDPASPARVRERWQGNARGLPRRSAAGLTALLKARYVFTTHGIFGSRSTPRGQIVVNIWHGEPPGKPVGQFDTPGITHADFASVCSSVGRAYRAAEFGISPQKVLVTGAARNDRMLTCDPEWVRARLGIRSQDGEQVWLWLPTYRRSVRGAKRTDTREGYAGLPCSEEELSQLDKQLAEAGVTLLLKAHPLADDAFALQLPRIRHLKPAELQKADVSLYQLLAGVDGLITDLSSVWIDFLLLQRPLVALFPDMDEYRASRGIGVDRYERWFPGPLVRDVADMGSAIQNARAGDWSRERALMLDRLHRFHDAGSTARLLKAVGLT